MEINRPSSSSSLPMSQVLPHSGLVLRTQHSQPQNQPIPFAVKAVSLNHAIPQRSPSQTRFFHGEDLPEKLRAIAYYLVIRSVHNQLYVPSYLCSRWPAPGSHRYGSASFLVNGSGGLGKTFIESSILGRSMCLTATVTNGYMTISPYSMSQYTTIYCCLQHIKLLPLRLSLDHYQDQEQHLSPS